MLKVRVQGTKSDIRWFREKLEQHPQIAVLQVSDLFSNKGTTKYFRMYAEIEESRCLVKRKNWTEMPYMDCY